MDRDRSEVATSPSAPLDMSPYSSMAAPLLSGSPLALASYMMTVAPFCMMTQTTSCIMTVAPSCMLTISLLIPMRIEMQLIIP